MDELNKLANFIMTEVEGEPSQNEGVGTTAIRIIKQLHKIKDAAQDLFDNRLGWSDGRNPYAPPEFWARLEQALEDIDPAYEQARADEQIESKET